MSQYVGSDGVVNETSTTQYVGSDGGVTNETTSGAATPATATISWTDTSDTHSITATITVLPVGSLAWGEVDDTHNITANVTITTVTSTLSWTEASDVHSVTVNVTIAAGTLTTGQFKNLNGQVLANLTGLTVTVLSLATLNFVKTVTGAGTNASGVMTLNDALFVSGTSYAIVAVNAAGTLGAEKAVAA